jgi:probable rRNA maturation factor
MAHDKHATDTAPEPDSPGCDDILYSDWVSATGAIIEASINTKIWPDPLVDGFRQPALTMLDDILSELASTKVRVKASAKVSAKASVSLWLCNDAQMRQLNQQHRQINKPTNVLSFPAYDMAGNLVGQQIDGDAPALLGDIVIAAETVMREADDMQMPVADHLIHLFVHGMLHLFGHDHIDDELAETMETLEVKFLANIGVPNPYQDTQTGALG